MRKIDIKYKEVLIGILRSPANGKAAGFDEIKSTVPVIEKIEMSEEVISLEEQEWKLAAYRVQNAGYNLNDRENLTFIDDVLGAEEE